MKKSNFNATNANANPITTQFFIPSFTIEYLPTNITEVLNTEDLDPNDEDLSDELIDIINDGMLLIYEINIKEIPTAYNELLNKLKELLSLNFLGDDDIFDYIPDLMNQMLHLAYCFNLQDPENQIPTNEMADLIKGSKYYEDLKEPLEYLTESIIQGEQDLIDNYLTKANL